MNHDNLIMAEEDYDRLRAKRAAYRTVVTSMINESIQILNYKSSTQDYRWKKKQNRLILILTMLKEKMELLVELDGKLLDNVKVNDIMTEIREAEFLKMDIMTAIANIKSSNMFSASITQHPNSQMCLLL